MLWLNVLLCVESSGSGAAGSLPLTSPTMGEGGGLFVQCGVHCVCVWWMRVHLLCVMSVSGVVLSRSSEYHFSGSPRSPVPPAQPFYPCPIESAGGRVPLLLLFVEWVIGSQLSES